MKRFKCWFVLSLFPWLCSLGVAAESKGLPTVLGPAQADYYKVVLGLSLVLFLIFAFGFILKRINGLSFAVNKPIKVVSGMSLGMREKVVLLKVENKQILIGVAPGTIRTLHVFDEGGVAITETVTEENKDKSFPMVLQKFKKAEES